MSNKFTESSVEEATLGWLESLGYVIVSGTSISPDGSSEERRYDEVILTSRLRLAIERINPGLPPHAIEDALRKIKIGRSPSLLANNHAFHKMLIEGVTVEVSRDTEIGHEQIWPVNFQIPQMNEWIAINQLTILENQKERRPDIIVYINGLPLAVIELKNAADQNASTLKAFNQLQTYKKDIPSLFQTNEILIASDGTTARMGSLTADWERFMPWRAMVGNKVTDTGRPELEDMINGIFEHTRLLNFIRNFVVYNDDGMQIIKKIGGYHQFHAVNKAVESTIKSLSTEGDKRIGVVWHTQGTGKSLTMAFYTGKIIQEDILKNPTIVVLTDRNDLDDQLFEEFSKSHELLRQVPTQAHTRKELQEILRVSSGGVIFTTIQKFAPERSEEYPLLSERRNIVVIADEAHRTQYEFISGFARHIRDALPNASFIAFTGTPIELADRNTRSVFGNYIDIYDIQRAVSDEFTVPIYYEARMAKLKLKEKERPKVDEKFQEITEDQEQQMRERLKSRWARLEAVVGTEKRIKQIAEDIIYHFEERTKVLEGKGMIVCMSRRICVELYDAIVKLRPEWHASNDDKGAVKVVMTGSATDSENFYPHIRNKTRQRNIRDRLKSPNDPLKLVIVRDMWLTGFDAPVLHTMYLDKSMKGHNLMQAIARVNRVFKDKPGGLIVDYIGIGYFLKEALSEYTDSDRKETAIPQEQAVAIMMEKYQKCKSMFNGFDYSRFFSGKASEQISILPMALNYILTKENGKNEFLQSVTELSKSFALAVPHPKSLQIRNEVGFFQTIRSQIIKYTPTIGKSGEDVDSAIRQIVSEAIGSQGVIDIFDALGLDSPDMTPLLSDKFLNKLKSLKQKNLALEMLRKILNDQIKARLIRNTVQSKLFSEMLRESIKKYQNRTVEAAEIINELIDMAKSLREANKRGEQLKLTEEELAFYDALDVNDTAVKVLGDVTLRQIAIDLVDAVRNNVTIDWNKKESVRARLRVVIKRLLRKHGYPPDKQEKATSTVLEQAEGLTLELTREMIIDRTYGKDSKQKVDDEKPKQITILDKIKERENDNRELKSSFRYDFKLRQRNPKLEKAISKSVSSFMNANGGVLFIGVDDNCNIIGLKEDYSTLRKQTSDGFEIEVRQSIEKYTRNKMANEYLKFIFHKINQVEICEIVVSSTPKPVFLYDEAGKQQECYVRVGNSSRPYTLDEFYEYWSRRFNN